LSAVSQTRDAIAYILLQASQGERANEERNRKKKEKKKKKKKKKRKFSSSPINLLMQRFSSELSDVVT
jgi:hypothetical protein